MTLDEFKNDLIVRIGMYYSDEIQKVYPLQIQTINLCNRDANYDTMATYLNAMYAEWQSLVSMIDKLANSGVLDSFEKYDSDASLLEYVTTYVTCETELQQYALVNCLRAISTSTI